MRAFGCPARRVGRKGSVADPVVRVWNEAAVDDEVDPGVKRPGRPANAAAPAGSSTVVIRPRGVPTSTCLTCSSTFGCRFIAVAVLPGLIAFTRRPRP